MTLLTNVFKDLKICTEPQKRPNSQRNLEGKNKAGSITLPDSKPHCKAVVTRTREPETDTWINGTAQRAQKQPQAYTVC